MIRVKVSSRNGLKAIILVGLFLFGSGCFSREQTSDGQMEPEKSPVRVASAYMKRLSLEVEYVGNIRAEEEFIVYPRVSGKIVRKVLDVGDEVRKGQTIALVDRDEVGLKYEPAPVDSPLDGVIGRVYVDLGTQITSQTAIARVVKMERMKVGIDIPEIYLSFLSLDQKAVIKTDAYPTEEFIGSITRISPVLDIFTRTVPVEITVDNSHKKFKSGMFARVQLIIREHEAMPVVPKEAVIGRDLDAFVYIVQGDKAVRQSVAIGARQDEFVGISQGIKEADRIVIMGHQRLYDGADVRIEE